MTFFFISFYLQFISVDFSSQKRENYTVHMSVLEWPRKPVWQGLGLSRAATLFFTKRELMGRVFYELCHPCLIWHVSGDGRYRFNCSNPTLLLWIKSLKVCFSWISSYSTKVTFLVTADGTALVNGLILGFNFIKFSMSGGSRLTFISSPLAFKTIFA